MRCRASGRALHAELAFRWHPRRRLAASWKEVETLRSELKEEMMNRKHIMEDIRIKQQAIAAQESVINEHMSFRHAHEQQRIEMQRAMQAIEQEKAAIDRERMQMQVRRLRWRWLIALAHMAGSLIGLHFNSYFKLFENMFFDIFNVSSIYVFKTSPSGAS